MTDVKFKQNNMTYMRAGGAGLILPAFSLGLWNSFGDNGDTDEMKKIVVAALKAGINSFDLANNYGPPYGRAEENFGALVRDLKLNRDEIIVSTKAGFDMWNGPYGRGGTRKHLIASCDASLKRMGLDYVDIFYHHRPDPDTPLAETCAALDELVKSGKALYIGISNYNKEQTEAAAKIFKRLKTPFAGNQSNYSLLNRKAERSGLKDYLYKNDLGFITYSPLAQGILTGKYLNEIPADSRVITDGRHISAFDVTNESVCEKVRRLKCIAERRGQTLSEMSLSWVMREKVTSVVIGASHAYQIENNVRALYNTRFSAEELKEIDEIVR